MNMRKKEVKQTHKLEFQVGDLVIVEGKRDKKTITCLVSSSFESHLTHTTIYDVALIRYDGKDRGKAISCIGEIVGGILSDEDRDWLITSQGYTLKQVIKLETK